MFNSVLNRIHFQVFTIFTILFFVCLNSDVLSRYVSTTECLEILYWP